MASACKHRPDTYGRPPALEKMRATEAIRRKAKGAHFGPRVPTLAQQQQEGER